MLADEGRVDARVVDLRGKHHIDLARDKLVPQRRVGRLLIGLQADIHAVRLRNIAHNDLGNELRQRRKAGKGDHARFRTDEVVELGHSRLQRFQRFGNIREQEPAVLRQHDVAPLPREELDIQLVLQSRDGVAQARLTDQQFLRRFGIVLQLGDRLEIIKLLQIHMMHPHW